MIDIHAHILPSIDDGARNASETFDMIREAEKNGITEIIATSHYVKDKYDLNKENRKLIVYLSPCRSRDIYIPRNGRRYNKR